MNEFCPKPQVGPEGATEQLRVTVPAYPSCCEIVTFAPGPASPTRDRNAVGLAVSTNWGFSVTVRSRGVLRVTGPSKEFVVPTIVIPEEPADVLRDALIERLTVAGAPTEGETVGEVKLQLAPTGKPLQVRETTPANDPEAVTERLTG